MIIDYSQVSTWNQCPWLWYEKYVSGMAPRYLRQRDDPLALGSLVHNGLDNYSKFGKATIDAETVQEMNPTPECFALAELLVRGYLLKYPREVWPVERTEEPVRFPLVRTNYEARSEGREDWDGVAKLDGYFYVPEDTTIESGLPGQTLTLSRGWWSREYKTKSPAVDRGTWIAEWAAKRQADFQLLALNNLIRKNYSNGEDISVQGVLVSVLEKPREYTPKRKCKGCGDTYPLAAFFVTSEGHRCPVCGATQKLKPYIAKEAPTCEYFRITITRTPEQLETARREITQVALAMEDLRERGMESVPPNRDNCITNRFHRKCEFAENHIAGRPVAEPEYVKVDAYRYIGL